MSNNISPGNLKKILNNNNQNLSNKNKQNKQNNKIKLYDNLNKLCIIIEDKLFKEHKRLNEKKENEKFNILFNIFKKIYEIRDKKNSIHLEYFISNYILKFVGTLNKEEYEFIKNLLEEKEKNSFTSIYDFFKNTNNNEIYKKLSSVKIYNNITFLSPFIKKNKYIKIPNDNDSNIKKVYFIDLLINFSMNPIKIEQNQINFLKKVLSNKYWDKFVDNYKANTYINYDEEIMLAHSFGIYCHFNFNQFIETLSRKIIEEKNKNKTTTSENIKKVNNIIDLFEIYYIITEEEFKRYQQENLRIQQENIEQEQYIKNMQSRLNKL
jgi:hypothetical protein